MPTAPFDTLTAVLNEHDISFEPHPEDGRIFTGISTETANYLLALELPEGGSHLRYTVALPIRATEARLGAVAELLLRINRLLPSGRFDLDFADGELRFFWSTWFPGDDLPRDLATGALLAVIRVADDWFPALLRVIFDGEDPREQFEARLAALAAREAAADDGNPRDAASPSPGSG